MVMAMIAGMAIGMILHLILGFVFAPLIGMFEAMIPASLIGMYGGMFFGMHDSMAAGLAPSVPRLQSAPSLARSSSPLSITTIDALKARSSILANDRLRGSHGYRDATEMGCGCQQVRFP